MKVHETLSYIGADVEQVYALVTDQTFRTESCGEQGARDYTVTVERSGAGATVTVVRSQEVELPDFAKKLTGSTIKVKQTEVWSGPSADGDRHADVKVSIVGQPAEMLGTATLRATSAGTDFVLDGDVKVSIPFIGKKVEPEVAKAIIASLRAEVSLGNTRLS